MQLDVIRSITSDYRVLPLVEKNLHDYIHTRHSSLATNKLLRCRWTVYSKRLSGGTARQPFRFPDIDDFHFYNGLMRYAPTESSSHRTDFRRKMRLGPGEDEVGQLPIAADMTRTQLPSTTRRSGRASDRR